MSKQLFINPVTGQCWDSEEFTAELADRASREEWPLLILNVQPGRIVDVTEYVEQYKRQQDLKNK